MAGSFLLFLLVLPQNHTEAEDAFQYARLIEEGQCDVIYHPHHLIYLPVQQGIFHTVQRLGLDIRAYYTARAVSLVSGALAIGFFYLIACRIQRTMGGSRELPWIAVLGLLFSYGFIRYACEVEIYVPALAMGLAALYTALRAGDSRRWLAAGILLASLALLLHILNFALVLAAIPAFYLLVEKNRKHALVHAAGVSAATGLVYMAVHYTCGIYRPPMEAAAEGGLNPVSLAKAAAGFGQCLLSANFLFTSSAITERLQQIFPYRVFAEELFAAARMPAWFTWVAIVTFLGALTAFVVSFFAVLVQALKHRANGAFLVVILLWLGGTMAPTLLLEPSNPELWILALAPLWGLILWMGCTLKDRKRLSRLLFLTVILLGIHNLHAGMGMVKSREGDYNVRKAEWILKNADRDDVIHTADSFVFSFYLKYWSDAEVKNMNTKHWQWETGERTFLFDDVFNPPSSVSVRSPERAAQVESLARNLAPHSTIVHEDDFGGIWLLDDELRDPDQIQEEVQ